METLPLQNDRTSRAHLQRACLSCRRRKSRCKFDTADPSRCLMCRFQDTECISSSASNSAERISRASQKSSARRQKLSSATPLTSYPSPQIASTSVRRDLPPRTPSPRETPFSHPAHPAIGGDTESHIIGPAQSADVQWIANYLRNDPSSSVLAAGVIRSFPGDPTTGNGPTIFNTVRRRPLGSKSSQSVASYKCEIVEKLIEPHCLDLINLYFEKVHQCFPLLDEESFMSQYMTEKEKISPALLASLYAHTMVFWRHSPKLSRHRCPDPRYVWNQAVEAVYSELSLSPGISTVIAILLNISGRPLAVMIGNGVLLGSAVSLAHALGLNRSCLSWEISSAEKCLRTRVWWAIVVYDKWSSVAYGTPPHLRKTEHDVSAPTVANIYGTKELIQDTNTASVFVAFTTLTDVLDVYLENVFRLQPASNSNGGNAQLQVNDLLTRWEDSLPTEVRRLIIRGVDLRTPGSSNLRLAYLYVKFLCRKLGTACNENDLAQDSAFSRNDYTELRRVAEEVVLFVQELDEKALSDFWLTLGAFALSSTVLFLLRCALESESLQNGVTSSRSLKLAQDMITALQSHRKSMGWDLGNICIAQYADLMEIFTTSEAGALDTMPDLQQFMLSNATNFDELFPNLWDLFNST